VIQKEHYCDRTSKPNNSIAVIENSIVIQLENPESYFEYSINGIDFQALNQFSYIPTGQYTAFVETIMVAT
jgi:hypothetical protein